MQLTFIAKKPVYSYYCHVKVALRRTVSERPLEIIVGIFVLLLATSLSIRLELKRRKNKTINHYYLMICRILKDQVLGCVRGPLILILRFRHCNTETIPRSPPSSPSTNCAMQC